MWSTGCLDKSTKLIQVSVSDIENVKTKPEEVGWQFFFFKLINLWFYSFNVLWTLWWPTFMVRPHLSDHSLDKAKRMTLQKKMPRYPDSVLPLQKKNDYFCLTLACQESRSIQDYVFVFWNFIDENGNFAQLMLLALL